MMAMLKEETVGCAALCYWSKAILFVRGAAHSNPQNHFAMDDCGNWYLNSPERRI
jgi:hypothetical protein